MEKFNDSLILYTFDTKSSGELLAIVVGAINKNLSYDLNSCPIILLEPVNSEVNYNRKLLIVSKSDINTEFIVKKNNYLLMSYENSFITNIFWREASGFYMVLEHMIRDNPQLLDLFIEFPPPVSNGSLSSSWADFTHLNDLNRIKKLINNIYSFNISSVLNNYRVFVNEYLSHRPGKDEKAILSIESTYNIINYYDTYLTKLFKVINITISSNVGYCPAEKLKDWDDNDVLIANIRAKKVEQLEKENIKREYNYLDHLQSLTIDYDNLRQEFIRAMLVAKPIYRRSLGPEHCEYFKYQVNH